MSRLLRIIIFLIIVLLLIFFGFRCSQSIPNGSKATANFIEKNQPAKENASTANINETANNDANKTTTEITLPTDEVTKSTEHQSNTHNASKPVPNSTIEEEKKEKINHSQPAITAQTKPKNEDDSHVDTTDSEGKKPEKENTDKTTNTNTVAITAGASIILKGVSFASGSDKLVNSSITILNEVAKTLKEKSTLHIEVAGYTDNQGNAAANTTLSQLRADQVKAHLVAQDIKVNRISTKGYGASSPIASNNTATGREQNRRVEIHVK